MLGISSRERFNTETQARAYKIVGGLEGQKSGGLPMDYCVQVWELCSRNRNVVVAATVLHTYETGE